MRPVFLLIAANYQLPSIYFLHVVNAVCCSYITTAVEVDPDKPVLVDKYLDRAIELDVDALCDKDGNVVICGIMEHIEQVNEGFIWASRLVVLWGLSSKLPVLVCLPICCRRAHNLSYMLTCQNRLR